MNDLIASKVDKAQRLLAEARDTESAKRVVDIAHAAMVYAKRQRLSAEAIASANAVKVDAMTLLGDFLKVAPKLNGSRGAGKKVESKNGTPLSLAELGIHDRKLSSDSQFLSDVRRVKPILHSQVRSSQLRVDQARKLLKKDNVKRNAAAAAKSVEACTVDSLDKLIDRGIKFGCIYADPPWQYSNQGTRSATDTVYDTMTLDAIAALPIEKLAADNAHLHMWTTNAFLFEAPRIFKAWGFEYKSLFVWVKPQLGIGNYWRVSHELLLLGVRGKCSFLDKSLKSWAALDRTEHSAKPEKVRQMVEAASIGPRLELFGRRPANGWVVWGNQIREDMFDKDVKQL